MPGYATPGFKTNAERSFGVKYHFDVNPAASRIAVIPLRFDDVQRLYVK